MKRLLLHYTKFIFLIVCLNLLMGLLTSYLSRNVFNGILSQNAIIWDSWQEELVVVLLFAPLLETLVFQVAAYRLFNSLFKSLNLARKRFDLLFILLSSLTFALFHQYNWLYMISAFLGALSLNGSYIYFLRRRFYPYCGVVLIHFLYNGAVLILHKLG